MATLLELVGWRKSTDRKPVPLFRSWHTIVVIVVGAIALVVIHRLS